MTEPTVAPELGAAGFEGSRDQGLSRHRLLCITRQHSPGLRDHPATTTLNVDTRLQPATLSHLKSAATLDDGQDPRQGQLDVSLAVLTATQTAVRHVKNLDPVAAYIARRPQCSSRLSPSPSPLARLPSA